MSEIKWDESGKKLYETGVDHGVCYPFKEGAYKGGVAWNGLTNITENRSGAEPQKIYADNINYLTLMSAEEYGITIEAYMYPDEFAKCDGTAEAEKGVFLGQQNREKFGMSYRTIVGNDEKLNEYGYKLHLVYNLLAAPSEKGHDTINDSPEAATLSWECSSTPIPVDGYKPVCEITIDSTKADPTKLKELEKKLYGFESEEAELPLPKEVIEMMKPSEAV